MSGRHAMVDIETLGALPGSVILSIGAVYFDDDGLGAEFYRTIDVFDSLLHGLTIDPATVSWWRGQTPQAQAATRAPAALRTLTTALDEFDTFLDGFSPAGSPCVWAKGPDFDLVLLQAAYTLLKRRLPWKYRDARDVRTAIDMAQGVAFAEQTAKHHALEDAKYQAEQLRIVYKHLGLTLCP